MPPLAPPLTRMVTAVPVLPLSEGEDGEDGEECSEEAGEDCSDGWLVQLEATVIIPISITNLSSSLLRRRFNVNYAPRSSELTPVISRSPCLRTSSSRWGLGGAVIRPPTLKALRIALIW